MRLLKAPQYRLSSSQQKKIRYINKQNAHYHYIIIIMIIFNFS